MKRRNFLAAVAAAGLANGQTSSQPKAAPAPLLGDPIAPEYPGIEAKLQQWAKAHPRNINLEKAGKSIEGRPIYTMQITDPTAPPDDKEHVLLTALHAGQERSGATGTLAVMEWLLSDDPAARQCLRRQMFLCIPVPNPDSYNNPYRVSGLANIVGEDPYTGWTVDGPRNPDRCPEAVVIQHAIDSSQAELHSDIHGNSLAFPGIMQGESSGRAYSNIMLRPYHSRLMHLMDEAAEAEGYPSDQVEEDAERLFGAAGLGIAQEKLWAGIQTPAAGVVTAVAPRVYAAVYGYNRYHTLPLANECGWDRSTVVRHRRLLRVGNEIWPGERDPGYPVRVLMKNGFHMVTAYGSNAAERRRSRIELWNLQRQITHGANRPDVVGRILYVCATSRGAADTWLKDRTLRGFAARIAEHPRMQHESIRSVIHGLPEGPGQWGHEANLSMDGGAAKAEENRPIQHGIALRLRLPFPKIKIRELMMNGAPVPESKTNGYSTWVARAYTFVQINVPPERTKADELFVVTCRYDRL